MPHPVSDPGERARQLAAIRDHARQARPDEERGRGLAIVAALATTSGVRAEPGGKTSWFTLALTDRAHQAAAQLEHEPEAGA